MIDLKNSYVNCKGWGKEDRILYIKACIGDDMPHEKMCGFAAKTKEDLLLLYTRDATHLYFQAGGMMSYDNCESSFTLNNPKRVTLADLRPRTKVEYVKCELNAVNLCKPLFISINGEYKEVLLITELCEHKDDLYFAVEREIEWYREAEDFASNHKDLSRDLFISHMFSDQFPEYRQGLLELCHLVASMTDKPE